MCGIVGVFSPKKSINELILSSKKMLEELRHRGPDQSDLCVLEDGDISGVFGHTRLSIIDLSEAGRQPFFDNKRFYLTFNGEIYNFLEIRNELNKNFNIAWKGRSDSEVLFQSLINFGTEKTLKKINGQFAFAFYDKQSQRLILARDRFGEKPLYYGLVGNDFIFSSELKTIKHVKGFNKEIDPLSLQLYFELMYIPSPRSIFKNIFKLKPGSYVQVNLSQNNIKIEPHKEFWNFIQEASISRSLEPINDLSVAKEKIKSVLRSSINEKLNVDVEIGAYLSGGIDSSLISAIASKDLNFELNTFSVGFENKNFDESRFAEKIAKYLGLKHESFIMDSNDVISIFPKLGNIYDEPFADSSQIPTYFLALNSVNSIKVALSGDGGDELFLGYPRYFALSNSAAIFNYLPIFLRKIILRLFTLSIDYEVSRNLLINILSGLISASKKSLVTSKLINFSRKVKDIKSIEDLYLSTIKEWSPKEIFLDETNSTNFFLDEKILGFGSLQDRAALQDFAYYLPDDLLTKVDRASMATGQEVRSPFLTREIFELSWRLDSKLRSSKQDMKGILKSTLFDYIPSSFFERKKSGFSMPISDWIRGPLNQWSMEMLGDFDFEKYGLDKQQIMNAFYDHQRGNNANIQKLWSAMIFISWESNL